MEKICDPGDAEKGLTHEGTGIEPAIGETPTLL
jgi:hypothetical protein